MSPTTKTHHKLESFMTAHELGQVQDLFPDNGPLAEEVRYHMVDDFVHERIDEVKLETIIRELIEVLIVKHEDKSVQKRVLDYRRHHPSFSRRINFGPSGSRVEPDKFSSLIERFAKAGKILQEMKLDQWPEFDSAGYYRRLLQVFMESVRIGKVDQLESGVGDTLPKLLALKMVESYELESLSFTQLVEVNKGFDDIMQRRREQDREMPDSTLAFRQVLEPYLIEIRDPIVHRVDEKVILTELRHESDHIRNSLVA